MEQPAKLIYGFFSAFLVFLFVGGFFVSQALPDGNMVNGTTETTTTLQQHGNTNVTLPWPFTLPKTDDWAYAPGSAGDSLSHTALLNQIASAGLGGAMYKSPSMSAESIGFSTGGAKDINNFRENIKNDYLPLPTDITYEGLFYDYYFDTGEEKRCDKLFCPSYSYAISKDPLSHEKEYYMAVGLNSGLKEKDFKRKKLNLVIVLDMSGSMSSPFNRYYYDRFGRRIDLEDEESSKTKIEIATKSVAALLSHLEDDDRFGMVLYNDQAYLAKPMSRVGDTDMDAVKDHILDISASGGTYMSAGMKKGTDLFKELEDAGEDEYENRIIFLTDAMPNIGETSEEGLLGITERNAGKKIYTTFIGIGVDFNTELVEYITKIRGANYYSVHSSKQFKQRMDDEFDYMVTPLVFDLKLSLDAPGYEIEKVYGSPEADEATGELMKVNTLFPSAKEDGETKGGIVLLKLRKTSSEDDDSAIHLKVSYEDREGRKSSSQETVEFGDESADYFQNNGIRKAVLLSRYADLMKDWTIDERGFDFEEPAKPLVDEIRGILCPPPEPQLGRWERQSVPLHVSKHYQKMFSKFKDYFEGEMEEIGDDTLEREVELLEKLSDRHPVEVTIYKI